MKTFLDTLQKSNELVNLARISGNVNQVSKALGLQAEALANYNWSLEHAASGGPTVLTESATRVLAEYPSVADEYYMKQGELL